MSKRKIYRDLSAKLNKALSLLGEKYKTQEIIELVKSKDKNLTRLSPSYFSKYKNVLKNDGYINSITEGTFTKILRSIDIIISEELRLRWNDSIKAYELEQTVLDEFNDDQPIPEKLIGLVGTWEGLSYNKKKSIKDKRDFYSYFKLRILDKERVICNSLRANFHKGRLKIISIDRVSIEISTDNRTIFLIGKIGLTEHLDKLNYLYMAYTDSGDQDVKSGNAILFRSKEQYDKLTPEIIDVSSPKITPFLSHIQLINGTQHVVPPSEE